VSSGVAIVAGLAFAVVFVARHGRLAHPLLDLGLFRSRTFTVALGTMLLGGIVMAGVSLMSTLHLQVVSALSPMGAGLWMLPVNIGLIAGSLSGPVFAKRFRVSTVVAAGLGVGAFGLLLQSQASASGGLGLVVSVLVLASFGIALPMALTMNLILGATRPRRPGRPPPCRRPVASSAWRSAWPRWAP
jgi:DHA2 family multidrug resistance protein-like MFS transporter